MKDNTPTGFTSFGFSSILIAFSMICVVTFGALSLVTANSDYKLSKKVAEKTSQYYEAENLAYETLSEIDKELYNIYYDGMNESEYLNQVDEIFELDGGQLGYLKAIDGTRTVLYSENLSDKQTLEIAIEIVFPQSSSDSFYKITKWQTVTNTDVNEGTLNLLD